MSTTVQVTAIGAAARRVPMRLTARGRRVLAALALAGTMLGGMWGWSLNAAAADRPGAPPAYVQVESGQTLWSIARQVAPDSDPRDVVDALMTANHLDSATVHPGTQLLVPDRF